MRRNILLLLAFMISIPILVFAQRDDQKYVEVCGVKWATGNLAYNNGDYIVFAKQFFCYTRVGEQSENQFDHFNFGITNGSCYVNDYLQTNANEDITGSVEHDICTNRLGESYRLPYYSEIKLLEKKANIYKAKYFFKENTYIEGLYFSTPEGKKREKKLSVAPKDYKILTDEDLENGLFLPFCNYRKKGGHQIYKPYKYTNSGYYWCGSTGAGAGTFLSISEATINIFFAKDNNSFVEYVGCGMSIRPVYCGE